MSVPPRAVQLQEANEFLKEHPEVQFVDLLIADMNGVVRGKRIERASLHKVYEKGINLPASLFALDINGSTVESTGLGLDICYRIVVKRHHGDLRVQSRPGETRFQVRLPVEAAAEAGGAE